MSSTAETLAELRAFLARIEGGKGAGGGAFQGTGGSGPDRRSGAPRGAGSVPDPGGEGEDPQPPSGPDSLPLRGRAGEGNPAERPASEVSSFAPLGHPGADAMLGGGLRRGALHEVFARGPVAGTATAFVCGLAHRLAECPETGVQDWLLWVQQDFAALESGEIAGEGLAALGLDPERLILARTADAKDGLRAAAEGLTTPALRCVLLELWGEAKAFDLLASRRLTLAAQASGVTIVTLRLGVAPKPSTAETRWIVNLAPSVARDDDWGWPCFDVQLARNRHGGVGQWMMEWDCDAYLFRPRRDDGIAPAFEHMDSTPADRPAEAPGGAAGQGG